MDLRGARSGDRVLLLAGLLAVATFVAHVVAASRMRVPIIQADEGAYLGNARFIVSGIGRTHAGYASGYSLLLAVPALLSHDPLTAYHLSLVVNAMLAASLPLLGVFLARRVLPTVSRGALIATALVLVVYPGWSTLTNLTLAENALIPAVLATACLIAVAEQSLPRWCLAAAVASYTSWVNPRGLLVVAAFGFACIVSTRPWKRAVPGVPALGVAVVVTVIGRVVNIAVAGTTRIQGVKDGFGGAVIKSVFHPHLWNAAAANLLGRIVYMSVATFGLVIVGSVVLTAAFIGRRPRVSSSAVVPVATFAIPALFLTLVLSATSLVQVPVADLGYLVYGRYIDGVVAPVLVVGAAWFFDRSLAAKRSTEIGRVLALGGALAVAVLVFSVLRPRSIPHAPLNIANAVALRIYVLHVHRTLPALLLVGVVVMTLVLIVSAVDRRAGAAVILSFLTWSSWVAYNGYAVHDSIGRSDQHVLVAEIDRLRSIGVDTSCVIVDNARPPSSWHLANYAFFAPSSTFVAGDPSEPKCGPLVVSAAAQVDARFPGARPVTYENHIPIGLWVVVPRVPASARDVMLQRGLLGPTPITAPLPDSAYRSSIQLVAQQTTTKRFRFRVHLGHVGTGAPWPGSSSAVQPGAVGTVRLLVALEDRHGDPVVSTRCALPRTMMPGDTLDIECVVPVVGAGGKPTITAGSYTLQVGLEQAGVTKFADKGDRVASLPVTLGS